ncbi:SAM-dependent methyltransferase [Desulfosporosinus nitroreducens]|uniref:SAM-dependent methyltransferase n=1 Tax=Desulfosporosinus nitroreducens TaxID=2018668 RepID=UPI00207D5E8B|nr:class I SAM-dependent methyltransferase [Desulfosporosinus nitroreducens]MCO1600181.1 class I SAM-dependent methyltransferase [Desulfosporosinus nitroreducens]
MKYIISQKYNTPELQAKMMGPNPLKLQEEMLINHKIPAGSLVCDLGSGQGVTSIMLAHDYGFTVYAADLWSEPQVNREFFDEMGLTHEQIIPVKADATDLPFEKEFFDAVVSTDSYNYWGRDPEYLDAKLLPFVKSGGYIYACVPGMKRDCHDNLPEELLLSWTPEQLIYLRDIHYWTEILNQCKDAKVISIYEMEGNEELWEVWLNQENEIAVNDRKTMEAGGGKYLNFIAFVLQKK